MSINPVLQENYVSPVTNKDEVAREAPRYVFFAGDIISPDRKREVSRLAWGGEELEADYKTAFITGNVLWRNKITPMLSGARWIPLDLADDNEKFIMRKDFGQNGSNVQGAVPVYPGDEVKNLLGRKRGKGLVELVALRGWTYEQVKERRIQQHFFPEWDEYVTGEKAMPKEISWTRARVIDGINNGDALLQSIGQNMLQALDSFELFALERLQIEAGMIKDEKIPPQFRFYTPLADQLFTMLEKQREDLVTPAFSKKDAPVADYSEILNQLAQGQALLAQVLAGKQTEEVKEVAETVADVIEKAKCTATKANGEPCNGFAKENGKCVFHQEKVAVV